MSKAIPALWTNQLNEVLFAHPLTRSHFRGTYGCDKIPNPHTVDHAGRFRPWTMVVNTQPSTSAGEHWLLLSAVVPTHLQVFDSYGLDFQTQYNNRWFRNFVGRFQTLGQNRNTYQSLNSNVCGHYCIYVAAQYGRTGSFESLPDITPNRFYSQNDAVVAHIASVCLDVEDVISNSTRSGQCCCSFVQKGYINKEC